MIPQFEFLLDDNIIDENYNLNDNALYNLPAISEDGELGKVYGTDTRRCILNPNTYPYFPIVRLIVRLPNGNEGKATGFLVGADKVVTAGHCIYNRQREEFATDIVAIAYPGGARDRFGACVGYRYSEQYPMNGGAENDWAILRLDTQLGNYAGVLSFIDWNALPPYNTYNGEVAGYPKIAQGRVTKRLWSAEGQITWPASGKLLRYTISTSDGESGSPVLIQVNGQFRVAGIHVGADAQGNRARVIDTELFNTFSAY